MANYKEILRLHSLGINNTRIAESCGCARSTVISTLQRADTLGINWSNIQGLSEQDVSKKLYPRTTEGRQYRMVLLKLTDKYPPERLENACRKALSYTPQPSYKSIQSILKSGQDKLLLAEPEPTMKKASQYSFTRGADYYRRDK